MDFKEGELYGESVMRTLYKRSGAKGADEDTMIPVRYGDLFDVVAQAAHWKHEVLLMARAMNEALPGWMDDSFGDFEPAFLEGGFEHGDVWADAKRLRRDSELGRQLINTVHNGEYDYG